MNLYDVVVDAFAPLIEQYGLDATGNERYCRLANEHLELRVVGGLRELSTAVMGDDSIGLPLETIVADRGGAAADFLPDPNVPIPDLEAYRMEQIAGYAAMTAAFLAEPLSGDRTWFDDRMRAEQADYELRTFVFNNAPVGHPARIALSSDDWREEAERFRAEHT